MVEPLVHEPGHRRRPLAGPLPGNQTPAFGHLAIKPLAQQCLSLFLVGALSKVTCVRLRTKVTFLQSAK